jgi:hypothetical protein
MKSDKSKVKMKCFFLYVSLDWNLITEIDIYERFTTGNSHFRSATRTKIKNFPFPNSAERRVFWAQRRDFLTPKTRRSAIPHFNFSDFGWTLVGQLLQIVLDHLRFGHVRPEVYALAISKFDLAIKKEHRGTYFCVATNLVGQGSRRNIDVEVKKCY